MENREIVLAVAFSISLLIFYLYWIYKQYKYHEVRSELYLDGLRAIQHKSEGRIKELDLVIRETQDSLLITSCRIEACRNENEFNNDCA